MSDYFHKEELKLYAVTDRRWLGEKTLLQAVTEAIDGGATLIQLREKDLDEQSFREEAIAIQALCRSRGIHLLINDNVQLAKEIDADGVHVGQSDMEANDVRAFLGPDKIIGVTAKTPEQAKAAEAAGADYLGAGAVFGTQSKTDTKKMSPEQLKAVCKAVSIPVVAIGGITADNAPELAGSGAAGIAVVSALFAADDIRAAAEELLAVANGLRYKEAMPSS